MIGVEEALASARPRPRAHQARPRHRRQHLGRRRHMPASAAPPSIPTARVEIEIGTPGPGHRHPHRHRHGGGRNARPAGERRSSSASATTTIRRPAPRAARPPSAASRLPPARPPSTRCDKLFDAVAPALGATPDQLEAVDGRIQVKGDPVQEPAPGRMPASKLGVNKISEMGENNPRNPGGPDRRRASAGVQMADVSVDTETGIVKMNKFVAVQDCGLVINPKTGRKPDLRRGHHGHLRALCSKSASWTSRAARSERRHGVLQAGRHRRHRRDRRASGYPPENDKRGVIGLGEPPAIGGIAAIGNAVANAIGVRVPHGAADAATGCWPLSEGRNA